MSEPADDTSAPVASEAKNSPVQFAIERIYLKDISFEVPMGFAGFTKQWKPQVNQDIATKTNKLDGGLYEVILRVTVEVKEQEKIAYLAEVEQAGVFKIDGLEGMQLTQLLNTHCPNILFPYAREVIDNIVTKGSFPALHLPPISFDALFQKAVTEARKNAGPQAGEKSH